MQLPDGTVWIGSNTGLHSASLNRDTILIQQHYLQPQGIEPSIVSMLEDDRGDLWIGTSNAGLFSYHPTNGKVWNITAKDGIFSNSFRFANCFKDEDGMLTFVNERKLVSFYPEAMRRRATSPKLYLTDLQLAGQRRTRQLEDFLFRLWMETTD